MKVIERFIKGIEKEVVAWMGSDPLCIIGLEPDGVFYAEGLYQYLRKIYGAEKVAFLPMNREGIGLWQEAVRGRKVLLIDNDIIEGKTYERAMSMLKSVKNSLRIKDIKFAVLEDRKGLADFVSGFTSSLSYKVCNYCKKIFPSHDSSSLGFSLEQSFCKNCRHSGQEIVRRFKRVYREKGQKRMTLDELTLRFNNLPGNTRVTREKIREYVGWGIGREVEPGIYEISIPCKRY
jgi:hypoxanthine phosphoribosyltransferase